MKHPVPHRAPPKAASAASALFVALVLSLSTPLPLQAQETAPEDGPSLMERGLSLFFDGFSREVEPALGEMTRMLQQLGPAVAPAMEKLLALVDDMTHYELPTILENGDIIMRRKPDAPEVQPPAPDSGVEL